MASTTETTKLSAKERQQLRFALRSHPQILSQVEKLSDVSLLDKKSLLAAAHALGIDIEEAKTGKLWDRPQFETDEGRDLYERSRAKPAFVGSIEEQITFVLLGEAVTRTLRVSYEMTPDWPYFDPETGSEVLGWEQNATTYELLVHREVGLIQPDGKGKLRQRKGKENWVNCTELFMHEMLGERFDEVIDDRIEEACLRQNEDRKRAFEQRGSSDAESV